MSRFCACFWKYGQPALLAALEECQACGAVSYEAIRFRLLQRLQAQALPRTEAAASAGLGTFGPAIAPPRSADLRPTAEGR
ncbi:MAG: hypothetical protein IMW99_08690 [Firmicutes bacterium]|nr:hypothetical protein [Bacillota bacterium]